jgi:hypothetical protein
MLCSMLRTAVASHTTALGSRSGHVLRHAPSGRLPCHTTLEPPGHRDCRRVRPGGNHPNCSQRAVTPKGPPSRALRCNHLRSVDHERIHDFFAFVGTSVTIQTRRLIDAGPAFKSSTVRARSGSRVIDLRNRSPLLHPSGVPSGLVGFSSFAIATTRSPPLVGVIGTSEDVR